jgi:hypothetical protein
LSIAFWQRYSQIHFPVQFTIDVHALVDDQFDFVPTHTGNAGGKLGPGPIEQYDLCADLRPHDMDQMMGLGVNQYSAWRLNRAFDKESLRHEMAPSRATVLPCRGMLASEDAETYFPILLQI